MIIRVEWGGGVSRIESGFKSDLCSLRANQCGDHMSGRGVGSSVDLRGLRNYFSGGFGAGHSGGLRRVKIKGGYQKLEGEGGFRSWKEDILERLTEGKSEPNNTCTS